jgi:hypothetical protein
MASLILSIFAALILYLAPGYILLRLVNFRGGNGIARCFLALSISLVVVPYAFISFANFIQFLPGLEAWLGVVFLLWALSWLLRYWDRRPQICIKISYSENPNFSKLESIAVWGFLLVFAILTNLPRLAMFLQGNQTLMVAPWDENWHFAQLVSVARSGLPPNHYFFPSLTLAYYYASWIYPAILANLPIVSTSLMRAMSIHTVIQNFAFLGIAYTLLRCNFRSGWIRLIGVFCFTLMGGFDLFANLPSIDQVDWWQRKAGWLAEGMQISQYSTLLAWVPHHIAGGFAFLFILFIWKNVSPSTAIKMGCTSILLAFCLTTSPFVFMASVMAVGLILLFNWRKLWLHKRETLIYAGFVSVLFLLAAWKPLFTFSAHQSSLTWSDLHVTVAEHLFGASSKTLLIDRGLTIFGLPLVAGWVALIEIGLPFILYLAWWVKRFYFETKPVETSEHLLLGVFPIFCLLLIFIIRDQGGGGNLSMRGMIPAQILIVFAALQVLETIVSRIRSSIWKRIVVIYLFLCFAIGQGFSSLAEIRFVSRDVSKMMLQTDCGWRVVVDGFLESCLPDNAFRYIYWLNQHTPLNALILETGPMSGDRVSYRWLERSRFLIPEFAAKLELFQRDWDFVLLDEWRQLKSTLPHSTDDIVEWYQAVNFRYKGKRPVYLVVWADGPTPSQAAQPVYQDSFVTVYALNIVMAKAK